MGTQRLVWLPQEGRLQFDGFTSYGEPVRFGGDSEGSGAKPSDLLPLSLAACTCYDVVEILRKQRQELNGLEVILECVQDPDPPWTFRSIHMRFLATGKVDVKKLEKAVHLSETKSCAVAATIAPVVQLSHSFEVQPR